MLRRIVPFVVLMGLQPFAASAQVIPASQWNAFLPFTGGTLTGPLLFPDGTAGAPSIAWASDADGTGTGMYRNTANQIALTFNGIIGARFRATGATGGVLNLGTGALVFGVGPETDTSVFAYEASHVFQLGADLNGAANAQTLKAHDGITGTDIAGANLTVAGGRGTGAGAGGNLILQTSPALATGTTAQVLETRSLAVAKQFTLSDAVAATFLVQTLGNDTGGGGIISYCVTARDATNEQIECGQLQFAGVDITAGAGGETCTTPTEIGTVIQAVSAGTLATTWSATTGTDLCNIRLSADTSLTPTALYIKYAVTHNSGQALTPQ